MLKTSLNNHQSVHQPCIINSTIGCKRSVYEYAYTGLLTSLMFERLCCLVMSVSRKIQCYTPLGLRLTDKIKRHFAKTGHLRKHNKATSYTCHTHPPPPNSRLGLKLKDFPGPLHDNINTNVKFSKTNRWIWKLLNLNICVSV